MSDELDKADKCLLAAVQIDNKIAVANLAEKCNLSTSSVQRRLKRLRKLKIITREAATLNPIPLGQTMTFIVKVELERESKEKHEAFRKLVLSDPHVQQCYYVTGEEDFILICLAPGLAEFEQLTQRLLFANSNVRRFKTSVVLNRDKVGLTVPLESI